MSSSPVFIYLFLTEGETDEDERLLTSASEILSASELDRSNKIIQPKVKRRYVLSRTLLRKCLSLHIEMAPEVIPITNGEDGKPEFCSLRFDGKHQTHEEGLVFFNLSHSENMIALAISRDGDIGVDIEMIRPRKNMERIVESYFSELEISRLAQLDLHKEPQVFYRYWTLKEAFTKALGSGLRKPFNSFGFDLSESVQVYNGGEKLSGYNFLQFQILAKYQLAVCVKSKDFLEPKLYSKRIDHHDDLKCLVSSLNQVSISQNHGGQSCLVDAL